MSIHEPARLRDVTHSVNFDNNTASDNTASENTTSDTTTTLPSPSSPTSQNPSRKKKKIRQKTAHSPRNDKSDTITILTPSLTLALGPSPNMAQPARLLVCSIGNPSPYLSTLHSAGHTVLAALCATLPSNTPLRPNRTFARNGLISTGPEYTLFQSGEFMNVSGIAVSAAWKSFTKELGPGEVGKLVVIHDELEAKLGEVRVKKGELSAKGHNGLKSIKEKLPMEKWWRIGVGIGRPESREPKVVANYVLRKMTPGERSAIEGCVGRVGGELARLRMG